MLRRRTVQPSHFSATICAFGRCDEQVANNIILAHVLAPKKDLAEAGTGCHRIPIR